MKQINNFNFLNLLIILIISILFLSSLVYAIAPENVKLNGFVNDYSNTLSVQDKDKISTILEQIYNSGKAEYSVVIVDSLEGIDIISYSYKVAEGNLGNAKTNNGLLLLISMQDRAYRFEVGRGLESEITDSVAGRIGRDYIVPNFKNEDYANGIYETSLAIKSILLNETESEYYKPKQELIINQNSSDIIEFIIFIFIIMTILSSFFRKKNGKNRNDDDLFAALLLGSMMGRGRGGFNGGFGGMGGSGGFGGFGGGSFGGGGAGGRW